ncbi:MAG: hypothetical protein IJ233_11720 [Pyramidobacter sp.]|nr:hypothetical protein [Pyramidobacter sp.]
MAENQFLPFATHEYANVLTQEEYTEHSYRLPGQQSGVAESAFNNKAIRQGDSMASAIGEFIVGEDYDALDDGDITALKDNFILALTKFIRRLVQPWITTSCNETLQKAYPVGCFFYTSANTNPRTLFGFGTWEKIRGRFLFAEDGSITAGSSGGEKEHTLTAAEMPSHNHTVTIASAGAHAHTASSNSAGGHSHTGTAASTGAHSHSGKTGSSGAHSHTITVNSNGAHSHTGTVASAGAHYHGTYGEAGTGPWGNYENGSFSGIDGRDGDNNHYKTSTDGAHSHSITIASGGAHTHTAGSNSTGSHTHSIPSDGSHAHNVTTVSAGGHNHTITVNSNGAHSHTTTVGTAGNNGAHNNMPPYLAVYVWTRTA